MDLKGITLHELEEARDKVRWGKERRSMALSEKEKTNTAYHEAGHALLLEILPHTEPLHKVTIIPRGPSLGSTMWLPEEDKYTNRKNELIAGLAVGMGGRVAEEIVFGDVTNGARGDIKTATAIARRMVCEWGMSEKMGMVEYGEHEDYVFLGRDISRARDYSEATAEQIDGEVRKLIDDAYKTAMKNAHGSSPDARSDCESFARIRDARRRANQRNHGARPAGQSAAWSHATGVRSEDGRQTAEASGCRTRSASAPRRPERRTGVRFRQASSRQADTKSNFS